MKAIKISVTDEISIVEVERPLYRSLNPIIGGGIEIVRPKGLTRPFVMVVDDEGLLKEREFNFVGCVLYETYTHGHPIAGDIVLMREEPGPDGYDLFGLSDQDISGLTQFCSEILARRNRG